MSIKNRRCGATTKILRTARLSEAPPGDSSGDRPRAALADQPNTQQKSGTSGAPQRSGHAPAKWKSPESGGQLPGQRKRQRSARGTPEDGRAKRPKQTGGIAMPEPPGRATGYPSCAKIIRRAKSPGKTS